MRRVDLGLIAILLAALAVRVWGIDFGLPLTVCRPDENLVVQPALEYFGGDFDPRFYAYGTLGSFVLHAAMRLQLGFELLGGRSQSTSEFIRAGLIDPAHWYLIARCMSAATGVATIWIVDRIGRELASRTAGLAGASLLALCFLHARDSHFGTLDVSATFFTSAAVLLALRAQRTGRLRDLSFAAACVGLAAATKYGGALAALAVIAAGAFGAAASAGERSRRIAIAGLVSLVAFFAAMPCALVHPGQVLEAVRTESGHLSQGSGIDLGPGWWRHASFSLRYGMGLPLLLAATAGAWLLVRRSPSRACVLLAFPVAYFAIAGSGRTVFVRYMLPLTPLVCALAAICVDRVADRLRGRGVRQASCVACALVLLLAAMPAWSLFRFDGLLSRTDSRLLAREWLMANAAPGASVAQTGNFARTQLPVEAQVRDRGLEAWAKLRQDRSDAARIVRMRVPPLQQADGAGYPSLHWVESRNAFVGEGGLPSGDPDFVIVSSSPLAKFDAPTPDGLSRALAERFVLATTIHASEAAATLEQFDPLDQFYLPFSSFAHVARPGPNLAIWKRK